MAQRRAAVAGGRTWTPEQVEIDIGVAQPARVDDYLNGGTDNFGVDRETIRRMTATLPGGAESARATARAARAFWVRVVRYLTAEAGMRQFLSMGTRIPSADNFHQVAQAIAPSCRFVYMAIDPTALARAHELRGASEGVVTVINAELRDPRKILRQAGATLDLEQPVALLFPAVLPFIARHRTARRLVAALTDGVAAGSHVAISHHANDIRAEELAAANREIERMVAEGKMPQVVLRSRDEVAGLFEGLELVEPGLVPLDLWWRPGDGHGEGEGEGVGAGQRRVLVPAHGGVARKP